MNRQELLKRIEELGRPRNGVWYQEIEFEEGVRTNSGTRGGGLPVWKVMKEEFLPSSLKGLRILDLGCNAGLYSVKSALLGAVVVGIELRDVWVKQAQFVKSYFEEKHGRLNLRLLKREITPDLLRTLGSFDIVYAISILYHFKRKQGKEIARELSKMTNNLIVRYRESYPSYKNSEKDFTRYFTKWGFRVSRRHPGPYSDRVFVQYIRD